ASQRLLGSTALACRLPSALAACLLTLLVYAFLRRTLTARAGLYAGAAIATCLQVIVLARAAVTDMLFGTCFAAACFSFYLWQDGRRGSSRLGWAAAGGVALGLATLTKGPVAPALLGAIGVLFLAWERRLRQLFSRGALVAAAATLLVAG